MGWEDFAKHLSEPLVKLIEVTSKGAGNVFTLCFAKRIADNKKYEIEQIGNAIDKNGTLLGEVRYINGEVSLESLGSKIDSLEERSKLRKEHIALKEQDNIERIVAHSAINLTNEESVSNEPVDEDWISRFFKYAEDITSKNMQEIWGRVLAGEIKQPNSYSLRTLETLRNLTKKEAELLVKVANLRISSNNSSFIFTGSTVEELEKYNFTFNEQLHLSELGILQSDTSLSFTIKTANHDKIDYFETGKYLVRVRILKDSPKYSFPVAAFTSVGMEILNLISPTAEEKYFKEFCKNLSQNKFDVEYAVILNKVSEGSFNLDPWIKFQV